MKKSASLDQRKKEHIELALSSQIIAQDIDKRFYYEPLLSTHSPASRNSSFALADKKMKYPIWVSSMTGGTAYAGKINKRLATACAEFGLGMGLGSCRIILDSDLYLSDFAVRNEIGSAAPLFANLGIAQVQEIIQAKKLVKIESLIQRLKADGLIIHVNPLQEWLQPEGDRISILPIDTITECLDKLKLPLIVKEVGQGMGPKSLEALLKLPLEAVEFAAFGGTNFSQLEIKRRNTNPDTAGISYVGHTATEMVDFVNQIGDQIGKKMKCKQFIISGGVKNYLDGYYLMEKLKHPSIYGQASAFLSPARKSYDSLQIYIQSQIDGLNMASNYLRLR